jgi:hypothetical protein
MDKNNFPATQSQSSECKGGLLPAGSAHNELFAYPATLQGLGTNGHGSDHPSLTSNNSIDEINSGIQGFTLEEKNKEYQFYKEKVDPILSTYQRKGQTRMEHIILQASLKFGREALASIDLTFGETPDGKPPSFDYANRCLNSLLTNIFRKRYGTDENGVHYNNFFVVCERGGKRGRIHFHILVAKKDADFFTGSFQGKDPRFNRKTLHPNKQCTEEWKFLRKHVEAYGFGARVRVQPLWDIQKGAKYFTKYVGKGHYNRNEEMKGRQLVRYGSGFKRWHSMKFSGVYGAPRDRREVLARLGDRYLCSDLSELNEMFGSRWQYYAGDQMRFMGAMCRGRLLPPQTITWLKFYLWNLCKLELISVQRQPFKHEVIGAYKYTIKETEAKEWITRSGMAPKSACEKTGLMTAQNMRKYAWRELCRKIECDAMGDTTFKPLPIVDGLYDMTQDTKNETKQQTNKQITRNSRTSVEPIGQLEIDGDFY